MQLLYYQAPISAVILIIPVLIFEPVSNLAQRSWSILEIVGPFLIKMKYSWMDWIIKSTAILSFLFFFRFPFCFPV